MSQMQHRTRALRGRVRIRHPCWPSKQLYRLQTRRRLHAGHFCKKVRQQRGSLHTVA